MQNNSKPCRFICYQTFKFKGVIEFKGLMYNHIIYHLEGYASIRLAYNEILTNIMFCLTSLTAKCHRTVHSGYKLQDNNCVVQYTSHNYRSYTKYYQIKSYCQVKLVYVDTPNWFIAENGCWLTQNSLLPLVIMVVSHTSLMEAMDYAEVAKKCQKSGQMNVQK